MEIAPAPLIRTADETLLYDTLIEFGARQIAPFVSEMDKKGELKADLITQLFELGIMGIEVPEKYGGAESSFTSAAIAVEALATVDPSVAVLVDVQNTLVQNTILRVGNEEQKQRLLPELCSSKVGSYALSEGVSGSDAFALKTRAEKLENGSYRLNGEKLWITNGAEAEIFIVFATLDPQLGYRGISAFIVEKGLKGFSVGAKEDKLGIRASSTTPLVFEDVLLAPTALLGPEGKGYAVAIETLNEGRIGIAAQMVGLAQGAFNHALRHLHERKQFKQRLIEFQGIQFQLAQLQTEIEAARLMVYQAARLKDAGHPFVESAAMAKLFTSQVAERVASAAVEFLGGVGFTKEYPVEKLYRDAKIGSIYEGTSNMQLMTIARALVQE